MAGQSGRSGSGSGALLSRWASFGPNGGIRGGGDGGGGAMLTSRTFLKRTRGGSVLKVVREHYLRDDVACGVPACPLCEGEPPQRGLQAAPSCPASPLVPGPHYLLLDTNVVLHQVRLEAGSPSEGFSSWPLFPD